jgi:hypothetical protein
VAVAAEAAAAPPVWDWQSAWDGKSPSAAVRMYPLNRGT